MDDRTREIIEDTLQLFENGQWASGSLVKHNSVGGLNYCLIGGINKVIGVKDANQRYGYRETERTVFELGFAGEGEAYRFNDRRGKRAVIKLLRETLEERGGGEGKFRRLHRALEASRLAHAEREIGKNVPAEIPEAWTQEQAEVRELARSED